MPKPDTWIIENPHEDIFGQRFAYCQGRRVQWTYAIDAWSWADDQEPSGYLLGRYEYRTTRAIAFTGTRTPPEDAAQEIERVLAGLPKNARILTGGAIGVDALVARAAHRAGFHVHTVLPANRRQVDSCWAQFCRTHEQMPTGTSYMQRNNRLVALADRLIAFPRTADEELRSGTWATVRRGRAKGVLVEVCPLVKLSQEIAKKI